MIFLQFQHKAHDKNTLHPKISPFFYFQNLEYKIVTFCDRILHKKNDGFFNNLELSCHHLGFFRP